MSREKENLRALILRQRGSPSFPLVLDRVHDMTEAEAMQWYRLLTNMTEDAKRNNRMYFRVSGWQ